MLKTRKISILAMALLICPASLHAGSIESEYTEISKKMFGAQKKGNIFDFSTSLHDFSIKNKEIIDTARQAKKPLSNLLEKIDIGMKVYLEEGVVLDKLIEKAKEDSKRLQQHFPINPEFGNPLDGINKEDLLSDDPLVRSNALHKLETNGKRLKTEYEYELEKLSEKKEIAIKWKDLTEEDWERCSEAKKILEEINDSEAGIIFNSLNRKFAFMLLDTEAYFLPALGQRATDANNVVKRYDSAIAKTNETIKQYYRLERVVRYFRAKDLVKSKSELIIPIKGPSAKNPFSKANEKASEVTNIVQEANDRRPIYSIQTKELEQIAEFMARGNRQTIKQSKAILEKAASSSSSPLSNLLALTDLVNSLGNAIEQPAGNKRNIKPTDTTNITLSETEVNLTINLIQMQTIFSDSAESSLPSPKVQRKK